MLCLDIWGRQGGGGALQALHFSFALGAFIAPVIIHPFFNGPPSEGLSSTTTVLPTTMLLGMLEPLSKDLDDSDLVRLPRYADTTPHYNLLVLSDEDLLALTQPQINTTTWQSSSSGPAPEITHGMQSFMANETLSNYSSTQQSSTSENDAKLDATNLYEDSTSNSSDVSGKLNDQLPPFSNRSTAGPNEFDVIPNNPKPARPKPSFTGATVKEQESSWKRLSAKKVSSVNKKELADDSLSDGDTKEQDKESIASESGSPVPESPFINEISENLLNDTNKPPITTDTSKVSSLNHAEGTLNSSGVSPVLNNAPPILNYKADSNMTAVVSDDKETFSSFKVSTIAPNDYSGIESSSYTSVSTNMSLQVPTKLLPSSAILSSVMVGAAVSIKPPSFSSVIVDGDHSLAVLNPHTPSLPRLEMNKLPAKDIPKEVPSIATDPSNVQHIPSIIPHTNAYSYIGSSVKYGNDAADLEQSNPNETWRQRSLNDTHHVMLPVLEPEVQDLMESQIKKPSNVAPIAETSEKTINSTNKIVDASTNIFHSIVGLLKKPGTFSNMTENRNKFIENIAKKFQGYGVTKIHLAFICISIFLMLNSLVFVVILCHNPREPRSKQEKGYLDQAPHSRYNFFLLVFSLFMFTAEALQGAIHHLLASNSETNGLSILDKGFDGPALFWGLVCLIRFLCIMLSGCIHLKPGKILGVSTFFTAIGTVFLCIGSFDKDDFMWSGIILASIGLAPILPTSLLWMSQHMIVTHKMCAVMIILTSFGNSLTHGGLAYVASRSHFYTYILVGLSLSSVFLLVLSWCIIYTSVKSVSNHLSASVANELTTSEGYRLARQQEDDDSDGIEMQGQLPRPRQEIDQHRQLLHDHHHATSSQRDQRMFLYQDEGALLID